MEWIKVDNGLLLEGIAISEGTYTGIDGNTIFYPREVLRKAYDSLVGKKVKIMHQNTDQSVVGYVQQARLEDDHIIVRVKVFDQDAKQRIQDYMSFSPEITVFGDYDSSGIFTANKIDFTGLALVSDPACPTANVLSVQTATLSSPKQDLKEFKDLVEEKQKKEETKMNTEECKKKLKESSWDEIGKECQDLLKKSGYPSPYPKPEEEKTKAKDEDVAKLQQQLAEKDQQIAELRSQLETLQNQIVELQKEIEARDSAELEKLKGTVKMQNIDAILEKLPDTKVRIEFLKTLSVEQKQEEESQKAELSKPKNEDGVSDEAIDSIVNSWLKGK